MARLATAPKKTFRQALNLPKNLARTTRRPTRSPALTF